MQALEQGVKYVIGVVLVSLLLTLNIFHICSSVSIVNFEYVITSWDRCLCQNNLSVTAVV